MERFERQSAPYFYPIIGVSLLAVFIADLLTPLGVVVWITYLVPVGLTFFAPRPRVPILVAAAACVLLVTRFIVGSSEGYIELTQINRTIGFVVLWMLAGLAHIFVRNKLYLRREEWIQQGQTDLSERMSGELPLAEVGTTALNYLSRYLEAVVAAIFVEDHGSFKRVAGFGLPQQGGVPEVLRPGDTLVGEVLRSNQALTLKEVPEGYLLASSSLGQARPGSALIAPLLADDHIVGVIEFGFFRSLHESDRELIQRVSSSIAVAIRSARYRERLQELLEETQRQAEGLQVQSEELRVANEELEEQSRALKESHARLEAQQAELEQTNVQLEEQTQLLEHQKDELERAKSAVETHVRELAQASRYKSDFLANMSHELRTPLNSSLILAKLLADNKDGNLSLEQIEYARTIYSAGNDLLALINEILDLSKIEAGKMDIRPESMKLTDFLARLERVFRPLAEQKGIAFSTVIGEQAPHVIETDPQRLDQIVRNLVANAVKFTERGGVTLEIGGDSNGAVSFAVVDTGIGIATDSRELIFDAFRQADGTTSRKYGGTGLGLSISRRLARLLGGDLSVTSMVGEGSTFTLSLPAQYSGVVPEAALPKLQSYPVAKAPHERREHATTNVRSLSNREATESVSDDRSHLSKHGRLLLVIEDDAPFARILVNLAHELRFDCVVESTADDGFRSALEHRPGAIVLDIGLPDHSGLSVLDRLKHDPQTRHIPVHIVSASDHTKTALELGAAGYLLKPVDRDALAAVLTDIEKRISHGVKSILIVEDDEVQLRSVEKLLAGQDIQTVGVRSANECLELLSSKTFDCMVLDLSLPDASGLSLLETLSREERYAFPPVIVYTGRDLTAEEEQHLRRFSSSIIIKGVRSPERLLDEVTLFLHQVVSDLSPEQQRLLEKARSRDAALEGRTILVVEDDVRNIFALTSILEPRGAKVLIARNGLEALAILDRSLEESKGRIDLVLMDIMMPEMDGLTATREIRKRQALKKLPVIALTAKAMRDDQEQCFEAGANDYMAKPLDVEKLLSLVRVWMPR